MLLSFKKDKALINILSDLELFLSETADKLSIDTKYLNTFTTVDNTRKFQNWNKIETIDYSNYVRFERYNIELINKTRIAMPWNNYDENKDISVQIFFDGKLLNPTKDYVIRTDVDNSNVSAGYILDFGPYLINYGQTYMNGNLVVIRTTIKLPKNVAALDIAINRYDKTITGTGQQNHAIPWGSINEKDLHIEVYVNGELWNEDLTAQVGTSTYKIFSTYIYFNRNVSGNLTIIRWSKK